MAKKAKKKREPASGDVATNRRARHKFEPVEKMEAGIVLRGSEVKSLRNGKAQMTDCLRRRRRRARSGCATCISRPTNRPAARTTSPSGRASCSCTGREIERLIGKTAEKGLTLIPLRIYFKGPRAKVELALARGKEGRDRRREIADRDVRREVEREFKGRMR